MTEDDQAAASAAAATAPAGRNWKFWLGIALLIGSFIPWLALTVLPMLSVSIEQAAGLVTVALITAEIMGAASVALLGKPFLDMLKGRLRSLLRRRPAGPPQPITRRRHALGVAMFFLSAVSIYPLALVPFLSLTQDIELRFVLGIFICGEGLFVGSLMVLGGDFWERFKGLFEYPAATQGP